MEHPIDFDDIFDIYEPVWWHNPWSCLFLGFLCCCILFLIWYGIRRYWHTISHEPLKIIIVRELKLIAPSQYINSIEAKMLYASLLRLIKCYFEKEYGVRSISQTDQEFLVYLKNNANATPFYPVVKQLVKHSSGLKFAQDFRCKKYIHKDYSEVLGLFS